MGGVARASRPLTKPELIFAGGEAFLASRSRFLGFGVSAASIRAHRKGAAAASLPCVPKKKMEFEVSIHTQRRFLTYAEQVMQVPIEPAVWAVGIALKLYNPKAISQPRVLELLKRVQYYAFLAAGCVIFRCCVQRFYSSPANAVRTHARCMRLRLD